MVRTTRVTLAVLIGVIGVVYLGTLVESTWTGAVAPCSRAIDEDSSSFQYGTASIQVFPPLVHCEFASTANDPLAVSKLPPATTDQFAYLGVGLIAVIVLVLGGLSLVVALIVHRASGEASHAEAASD